MRFEARHESWEEATTWRSRRIVQRQQVKTLTREDSGKTAKKDLKHVSRNEWDYIEKLCRQRRQQDVGDRHDVLPF